MIQKEEALDKKMDNLERKEEKLQEKIKQSEAVLQEAEQVKKHQFDLLEKISGYTLEQAKEHLLSTLEDELTHEKAVRISNYELRLKEESEQKAREIISQTIQRCAADRLPRLPFR
jgi:ribonuclease Y